MKFEFKIEIEHKNENTIILNQQVLILFIIN